MNDPVQWLKANPNKAMWGFLILIAGSAALGYFFPGLIPSAKWFIDNFLPLIVVVFGLFVAVSVLVALFKK